MSKVKLDPNSVVNSFRALESGLQGLTLGDNFRGFYWEGSIAAGAEVEIRNKFREGVVPTGFLVVDASPFPIIARGTTPWSKDAVYLRNGVMTNTITCKVFFFAERAANE